MTLDCPGCVEPITATDIVAVGCDGKAWHHECLMEAERQAEMIHDNDENEYLRAKGWV